MIIDAHLHVWQIDRGDYDWLRPDSPICRDFRLEDMRLVAPEVGGAVLVQAAPTEAETDYLLAIARTHPDFVHGVVGWTDLAAADATARIEALARETRLVGLRPMLQDIRDPDWILRPEVSRALDAMAACDLVLDLLIRPVHLKHCITLARLHPGLRMIIDHAAKPAMADCDFADWAEAMAEIAGASEIGCKLSGLITEAGGGGWEAVAPYARRATELFAPDRLVWGSDWPVLCLAADYPAWLGRARAMVRDLAPSAEADVFAGNARRLYRLAA